MAPLSKALAGVLLPHDTYYGNHLDSEGKTTDTELEKKNFKKAGESLAEIWGEMILFSLRIGSVILVLSTNRG